MMEVESRRIRRFGVQRHTHDNTLLPLYASSSSSDNVSNTISCWYCDFKIFSFNKPLFQFGRRHARFLKVWFSIGVGFALSALLGVTFILLWELARALHLCGDSNKLGNLASALLFGFPPLLSGLSLSLADAGCICISTIVSVFVHEFGHAVAATSEGIQVEYIAIFIAVLFPGALVAFNYELLQALPHLTALRVYSAGIWHNAVCCAACGLALFLLPLLLFPFYSSGHNPMVLDVPPTSPLSSYLAPGDLILSVDNVPIRNAQEWLKLNTLTYNIKLNSVNISQHTADLGVVNKMKGYCVPSFMMEESKVTELLENQHACPSELTAFVKVICSANMTLDDGQSKTDISNKGWNMYCLNAKDVVKLKKCGDDWGLATTKGSGCACSQDEFCLAPVQEPGLVWVEITYSSPHECSFHERNRFPVSETSGLKKTNCGGTFIFVGDLISMAHSIQLTSYQPRWGLKVATYFPNSLERILIWTFHVSLALALLNSLPVHFLDGESILDATLSHFTSLSPRKRKKVLRLCLLGGLLITIIGFIKELL
ncbi:membrane-bound transcription factor site-2 protease homolog [Gastrolobium bilobum]|uniref:membrane-bound transcription factor site-2 protease homolog n=1 Tax=Gastrolobium bilobum TaxID=150636 RepID=UPI002AB06FF0|nr:membrane-bound transcription factor site-2 protease homolog [Gastrolobium bilobum]